MNNEISTQVLTHKLIYLDVCKDIKQTYLSYEVAEQFELFRKGLSDQKSLKVPGTNSCITATWEIKEIGEISQTELKEIAQKELESMAGKIAYFHLKTLAVCFNLDGKDRMIFKIDQYKKIMITPAREELIKTFYGYFKDKLEMKFIQVSKPLVLEMQAKNIEKYNQLKEQKIEKQKQFKKDEPIRKKEIAKIINKFKK